MTAEYVAPQPGDPGYLDSVIAGLTHMVAVLSEDTMHHLDNDQTPEGAVLLLHQVREVRKGLAEVEASIEATAAQRMTGRELRFAGYVAERKGGGKRTTWEHDRVAWAVTVDLTVDANGETDDAAAALVAAVRDRLVNTAGISYWRSTQLRALGLDPSAYSTWEPARHTVHVRPEADEATA